MTARIRVVLLFGGTSSEHSISCATASGVLGAIDRERFEVIPVGITPDGAFTLQEDDASALALDADALPRVADNGTRVRWPDGTAGRELTVRDADGAERSLGRVDVVFPILHGTQGEDGTVQGMLELAGLPYVGSGVLASALGMDKHYAKTVLRAAGIEVAPWITVSRHEWAADPWDVRERAAALGLPAFVKPARAGSSVGVSRVSADAGLDSALEVAFREDDRVLVESGLVGREVECAILDEGPGREPSASVAGEIVVSGRDFYDFDAKYLGADGIDLVCPADVTDAELAELRELSIRAFRAVDARGLARVDFFLTAEGFVLNEINTMPGFTPISMFPACWEASGLAYPDLISRLLDVALAWEADGARA
ncbi:D-alanine--D-alanine ligase family protein [Clavibacter michiganensis]|uniref:D-alanine--D-alanine ligase family protein n=1 Tax=Clavibacter michiganensis TaxID=28447 RepID=UPI00136526C9|nr:D-alanine--D-alanine ligase family protein [Clavibacter michiganensis]MDO4017528.1 D-alanine--D-alanine ligase family protein [Clavibacter michiganensis]MDO4038681.1 D-alanine--D-alanine ligase family protein [Clavibacter michiganensis]MDO4042164.1 D-alanine--D-alanine ligase family protein [Clavibacter michiganensis]MDO4049043.1 D-alanine--D-alanine ligase family protein [Clavibacter michiganensis]MDO4059856.1 D-alanine--D-alanine ligase family protein [Clavibacter michiganensis]